MKSYLDSLLELVYPEKNTCFICDVYDEAIRDNYICSDCEKSIKILEPPLCSKCSKPLDYSESSDICKECFSQERCFETSKSLYAYDGLIKKAIYNYKYYNKPYYYKLFGKMLIDYMKNENYTHFDFILSVPLHHSKMRKRGYNQSELLARYISKDLQIPYLDALKRTKKTLKQSEQSKEERRKNLKGAFAVKKAAQKAMNSQVLLVDDIYTTGSTVEECSKVLIDYGVSKVYVITIAR